MSTHILHGDLDFAGVGGIQLENVRIEQTLNKHTILTAIGIYEAGAGDGSLDRISLDNPVEVVRDGIPIFNGIITNAALRKSRTADHVEITALSHTFTLDRELKSRSFQDKDMTYEDMINEVLDDYPPGSFLDKITEGEKLENPVIQYNETSWTYLQRMASRFNTCLVTHAIGSGARFYFGLPDIDKGELKAHNYHARKDFEAYSMLSAETSIFESDCIYYEVETEDIYNLGDKVRFRDMPLHVIYSLYEYKKGVIINRCLLSSKNGAQTIYVPNNNISGCSIFGEVIDVARDKIKIHLEIDDEQSVGEAYWYPYATMYASQDETGWYCMPELGDTVRLYHPENEEERAMAINSVKPHDPNEDVQKLDPGHRMVDPDVKYLRTAFGKELRFRPDGIDIIAKDGTVFMTLDDDGIVNLNSNDKISFTAVNDINIKARNINVEATDHVLLKSKGSFIDLEEDIVLSGQEVKTN